MSQICASCGATSSNDAVYCAGCGRALKTVTASTSRSSSGTNRRWVFPVLIICGLLVIAALYFWLFIADDLRRETDTPAAEAQADSGAEAKIFFTMTEANIRDKPTTAGSAVLGKLPRGSQVTGTVRMNGSSDAGWLELKDGNGFVALVNLAQFKPPELVKSLNDQIWVADAPVDVWATTLPDSDLLDRVRDGAKLTLVGVTANDFIEVKLTGGRYGYLNGAASILARLGGRPISISFDPQTCAFAGEIAAEFAKLAAQSQTQWQSLESREFESEAARDQAFSEAEGKSAYVRLRRSFEGLSVTGLGQHYESQSLYFDDAPAKVIDVFRAQGFDVGRDGVFTSTELYAGITPTRGEGAAYGKTELNCGV